jgi:chromosome segregation ATPase
MKGNDMTRILTQLAMGWAIVMGTAFVAAAPARAAAIAGDESFTCPRCGWTTKKMPGDDERLNGYYERIKAHSDACFQNSQAQLQKLVADWKRRQAGLDARRKQWDADMKAWKNRADLYETARARQAKDVQKFNVDRADLNRRIDDFNRTYTGRKLDEATYNYAASLKAKLADEDSRLESRRGDLTMIGKGLEKSYTDLTREMSGLNANKSLMDQEQATLNQEKAALEKKGAKF